MGTELGSLNPIIFSNTNALYFHKPHHKMAVRAFNPAILILDFLEMSGSRTALPIVSVKCNSIPLYSSQNIFSTSHAYFYIGLRFTWTSGAGSMINTRSIFTISSRCLAISCLSCYSNTIILLMNWQYRCLIYSQFSTSFSITFGFCPGCGFNF